MLISPIGIIGVETSYSRKSFLGVVDIEEQSIKSGIKYVGIIDRVQNFWIEDIYLSGHQGVVKLFATPERILIFGNHSIKIYVCPLTLDSLEKLSQLSFSLSPLDLKELNAIIFYSGNDKEHVKILKELFFDKLGIGITPSNRNLAESLVDSVDFFLPFYFINAPREFKDLAFLRDVIKEEVHPFIHATSVLSFLDGTSKELQSKILYTEEHLVDVRELRKNNRTLANEHYSSLLWALVSEKVKVDEEVRKEFIYIKENELSEFFYKLFLSIIEFSKHGYLTSDLLSTSVILRKMKMIKVNTSSKVIPLRFFLREKPLYLDIYHSNSQEVLEKILLKNFDKEIFHRIYPVHLGSNLISKIVDEVKLKDYENLTRYLENVITTYRVSKNIFYSSNKFLVQHYKSRNEMNLAFCGKSYDIVMKFRNIKNHTGIPIYSGSKIFETIRNDRDFITPSVASVFWNNIKRNYEIRGFKDCLKFFHLAQILSTKPYLRHLVWEAIERNVPIFIEDILPPSLSDGVKKNLVEIVFQRDKTITVLEEVDLFRLIMEEDIPKDKAQRIVDNIKRYKPILGTESLEKQSFYEFLFLAYLKANDVKKFLTNILSDRVLFKNSLKLSIILQTLSGEFKILPPSINGNIRSFRVSKSSIRLPLILCRVKGSFLMELIKERKRANFLNFYDFYKRVGKNDPRESNKLVKCGVFDDTDDRSVLLGISKGLKLEEVLRLIIADELRIMGVSTSLLSSSFSSISSGYGNVKELLSGETNKVFGFVVDVDKYGNFYLQDKTGTAYIRNKIYTFRKGQSGFFEIEFGESDGLGRDLYCKYYTKNI
jgi:hypothetical protein